MWEQHVARLTESDFKLRYRLTADAFHYDLLPRVRPHLVAGEAPSMLHQSPRGPALDCALPRRC